MKLYLALDENSKVRACQVTKDTIADSSYIEVDEKTYNQYSSLKEYETMTYENSKFISHPDTRPQMKITAPTLEKVGVRVIVGVEDAVKKVGVKGSLIEEERIIEYECPDGRIGLLKAKFVNGVCQSGFVPDKSGYYRFTGSANYKPEEVITIAVYDE